MRLTAALIGHELRFERRSLRFRAFSLGYLALGCLPALLIFLRRQNLEFFLGAATYAAETYAVLPFLTVLLAALLSLDGISRERNGGAWTTATLAGVSNAGYLLRRWIALLALILPLTALPPAAAAGLAYAGGSTTILPATFFGPWLLHVLPLTAAVSALALGLGTISGNAPSTFILLILALVAVPAAGNAALDKLRLRFDSPLGWLDLDMASRFVSRVETSFRSKDAYNVYPSPATEAGFDAGTEAEQELAGGLLFTALAAAALGTATLYLRRTRPDVRPQRIRKDHPLRNFLVALGRLREQYTPDPAPAPADLALFALAILAAAGAVALQASRALRYQGLAETRWQAQKGLQPAPTPADLVPEAWRVEGGFTASGTVALRVTGTLRNGGREPRGHLAFVLDPGIQLAGVELAGTGADAGRLTVRRDWERMTVDLDPPIPPGGSRELRFRLAGRPGEPEFGPPPWKYEGDASFMYSYRRHRDARFSHDRADLSRSFEVPAVSGFRVGLTAPSLTPVPRYTPWSRDEEGAVLPETFLPAARIELSLAVPRGLLVADSCGGLHDPAAPGAGGKPARLDSRCTLPLSQLAVMGGRQRLLPAAGEKGEKIDGKDGNGGTAVAVFPGHKAAGELHLGFLTRGTQMMDEAWPGLGGLGRLVVLEWPSSWVHDRLLSTGFYGRYRDPRQPAIQVTGNLVFLDETDLISTRAMPAEPMVAEIVSARLAQRRRLAPDDSRFFRQLFRTLALQRLGLGPQGGAVVAVDPKYLESILVPAARAQGFSYWSLRFPALVAALGRRAGTEPLRASVEELLAPGHGDQPATLAEWIAILERRSESPIEPLVRDFIYKGLLPEPTLADVEFLPAGGAGGAWRVTGKVRNEGEGEALCRVVLTTDLGSVETLVRTGTGETAPFVLSTPHRPQGVYLDPDQECHRRTRTGIRDRIFFHGGHT
jgi:hypothetical protein